jgi:hypothetical protein
MLVMSFCLLKWMLRCVKELITKDARGNDSDQGSTSGLSDHGDRDNDDSGCRCSVIRAPHDGGT